MKVLIIGRGVSGNSAFELLKSKGFDVKFAKDEDINDGKNLDDKEYLDRLFGGLSFIVISPGIDTNSKIILEAKKRNIKILGELELGVSQIDSKIIAITGTNGKTTTVSLIGFLLNNSNLVSWVGGNIGTAVTSFCDKTKKEDVVVLECSSYQLESVINFHPHISAILNITPDHLSRHKTMQNYILAKQNITKNQTKDDYLLINADSEILMRNIPKTDAKILYFSTKRKVFGCYIKNGCIYFSIGQKEKKLVSLKNIKLVGEHNLSNILCASLAVFLLTGDKNLLLGLSDFQGIEHRIEFVRNIGGISFYNDSKATNIDSTLVAIKSFKCGINLILGGSEKGYDFDELFANLTSNVVKIAVFGQTKPKILASANKFGFKNIYSCDSLKACTKLLFNLAKPKEIVLLSPACASFDHFKNFEERGRVFKKIVWEISEYEVSKTECKKET